MQKIKKGDEVIVIAGRDRGKRGNVLQVLENGRALVDSVNIVKKHVRANPNKGETGGILEKEAPINISNIAIYNPTSEKADRVGIRILDDGNKVRVFRSSGEHIDA